MLDWSALLGDWPEEIPQSNNISPGQLIAAFTVDGSKAMRWGLIPSWSDEVSGKYSTFNARIETISSKPAFRHAWSECQRCLIPALGYFEWRTLQSGKQPYFIRSSETKPLFFAGLYESAREQKIPSSCSILTQPARSDLAGVHPRMPVILPLDFRQSWFESSPEQAMELARADHHLALQFYPVSKKVNNARNEAEDLVDPMDISAI
ncbi:MAG: SOS response-associated peptidase [Gammaproteobacteria bacterium]|nr:SOS response-associated peptidase [Gammaproteobacteria bacterium]